MFLPRPALLLPILVSASCLAAEFPAGLNGRWDLTVPSNDRKRAWWVEFQEAGTPKPHGSFIGASGGGLDKITQITISKAEVSWTISKPEHGNAKAWTGVYKAHLDGDRLVGSMQENGGTPIDFTGRRAPVFRREDPSAFSNGKLVELFNGRDLTGWKPVRENLPMLWKVEGGILKNAPGTTDIVSDAKFMDFRLHAEYKVGAHSNSGIGLRARYEVQILEDFGQPADTHGNGALYSRILPTSNASKPAGEWQTVDITLIGNVVTVVLNGTKIIDSKEIDGLTAMAISADESEPGPIMLQGDHGPVEFRKLTLTPLVRR